MQQCPKTDTNKKLIYIASPYAGDIEGNTKFAVACCRYAIGNGYTPIAPHLLYPQMLDDEVPEERMLALMLGRNLLAACDEVWVCGERISSGMAGEIEHAQSLGIPIRYIKKIEKLLDAVELRLITCAPTPKDGMNYTGLMAIDSPEKNGDLVLMSEIMELLTGGNQSFIDLEPVRRKYEERFGDEQCWTIPICIGDHLGAVIMPVREGVLYLPYDGLDQECYEQFVLEDVGLLEKEKAVQIRALVENCCRELSFVFGFIEQKLPRSEWKHPVLNVIKQ